MGAILASAIVDKQVKMDVFDKGATTFAPPEDIAKNTVFEVATDGGQGQSWVEYMEEKTTDKFYLKMKVDCILEALQPSQDMNEEFDMHLRLAYARKEEWAVQMQDLIEAFKYQARTCDEMYESTKIDWLTKKFEFGKLETHGEKLKAGLQKTLKRTGHEAGLEQGDEEPAKSPRTRRAERLREREEYRRAAMAAISAEFNVPIQRILQESDIPSRIFTIVRSSGEWCKLLVKGGVLNCMYRIGMSWAEAQQWSCLLGYIELEFKAWLQTSEGAAFYHDGRRGYGMNYEVRIMMEQINESLASGDWNSVPERRAQRQLELQTVEGQEKL